MCEASRSNRPNSKRAGATRSSVKASLRVLLDRLDVLLDPLLVLGFEGAAVQRRPDTASRPERGKHLVILARLLELPEIIA